MALGPSTIGEGVPGLEGRHVYRGFTLQGYHTVRMPCARVRKITGLHGRADSDDNREPLRGAPGERVLPSHMRGRTVIYEGVLQGRTLTELRQLAWGMRGAFGATTGEDWMHVTTPRGGVGWYALMRPIDLSIDDEQTMGEQQLPSPWQRPFTLTMRASKPYWASDPPQADSGLSSGTILTRFNEGNYPADPIITMSSMGETVVAERVGGPEPRKLTFSNLDSMGGVVSLDFGARTMFTSLGGDAGRRLVMAQSNWWDDGATGMRVGQNDIRVTGANWELFYRHTSV